MSGSLAGRHLEKEEDRTHDYAIVQAGPLHGMRRVLAWPLHSGYMQLHSSRMVGYGHGRVPHSILDGHSRPASPFLCVHKAPWNTGLLDLRGVRGAGSARRAPPPPLALTAEELIQADSNPETPIDKWTTKRVQVKTISVSAHSVLSPL